MKKSVLSGLVTTTMFIGMAAQAKSVKLTDVPAGCKNLAIKQAELMSKTFNSTPTPADNDGNPRELTLGLDPSYTIGAAAQTYQNPDPADYPEEIYAIEVDTKDSEGNVYSKHVIELSYGSRSGCSITGIKH